MNAKKTMENMPTLMLDGGLKYKGQVKAGVPHGKGRTLKLSCELLIPFLRTLVIP